MKEIPLMEERILAFWEEEQIFQKTLDQRKESPTFVFYEGPPTANARPGIHHVITRAFKDVMVRYKTMRGYYVPRRAGWDTHGLPVELEVEKQLEISGKPDIEKYGVEKFNALCKESVWKYKQEWEAVTRRMGYWLDMDHPYITYETPYIESVWSIVKKLDEKGLLYKGHRVVPHCPRCGTALSSHEVAQGYKTVTDTSLYVAFKLKNETDTYILSWTTTPWTLPGNVALAVHPDVEYVKAKKDGKYFYCAKALAGEVLGDDRETEETVTGKDLLGKEYEPLFPGAIDPGDKKAWMVVPADFVTTTDGTGVVHTAVMYGEDDYRLGQELNLPSVHTVDENGHFLPGVESVGGRFVKSQTTETMIIEYLQMKGLIYKVLPYEHEYPFCWRCSTPLLYYAKDSWFIQMTAVKEQLIANNQTIDWVPAHIRDGRFGEWLEGLRDWAISRERYWGTPLPIWECDSCNAREVIGSIDELKSRATNTTEVYPEGKEIDLHKPFIDSIVCTCSCGGTMKRVSQVMDCWFDSGAMPFAQGHYPFENKEAIDDGTAFPADYICEAIDQTRGWFYTLLAVATALGYPAPYKHVICLGHILDAKGQKMSKSKGNTFNPMEVAQETGFDAVRYYFYSVNQPGEAKSFDIKRIQEVLRNVTSTLLNVTAFYELYVQGVPVVTTPSTNAMDRWVISRLGNLTARVTNSLDEYDVFTASRDVGQFIQELSTWYTRRSRDRMKDETTKADVINTLRYVLKNTSIILAPMMPFLGEELYQRVMNDTKTSVHLASWPELSEMKIANDLETQMTYAQSIVERVHALRSQQGIRVRQPLSQVIITQALSEELCIIIAEEVNVKEVRHDTTLPAEEGWIVDEEKTVALNVVIDQALKEEGLIRDIVRQINSLRKDKGLTIQDRVAITITADTEIADIISRHHETLAHQVLATSVSVGEMNDTMTPIKLEQYNVHVSLE